MLNSGFIHHKALVVVVLLKSVTLRRVHLIERCTYDVQHDTKKKETAGPVAHVEWIEKHRQEHLLQSASVGTKRNCTTEKRNSRVKFL